MYSKSTNYAGEISFLDTFNIILYRKFLVLSVTLLFSTTSVFYALSIENKYTATSLVQVINNPESRGSNISQYSGIASMAGINLSGSFEDKSQFVIEKIMSKDFFNQLISNNKNVLPNIFASMGYDFKSKTIIYDNKVYDHIDNKWTRVPPKGRSSKPSYIEAHKNFTDSLKIIQDKKSKFIRISFEHHSPTFAKEFIELIILELNTAMKNIDSYEIDKALEYLSDQAKFVKESELKSSINELTASYLEKKMLLNVREMYILNPIDSAYTPELKSSPKRAFICILSTLIGFTFIILFIVVDFLFLKILPRIPSKG